MRESHKRGKMGCSPRRGVTILALMTALTASTVLMAQEQLTRVRLDGNDTGRIFDGLGAVSAGASSRLLIDYPEPQRSQILDYLFKPGYGAALQRLKIELGADVNSTDGSEPSHMRSEKDHSSSRGYEWWLMKEAHMRNPNIVLEILPWGAPRWVNPKPGAEDTLYTSKMAQYVVDFIETARRDYGLDIDVTGIWNERVYNTPYIKELHRRLEAEHLKTKIVCCDEYPGEGAGQWAIADEILKDPELATDIYAIGVHYPRANGRLTTTDDARKTGKPLWSSEDQPNGGGGPFVPRDWPVGGRILAHLYNLNYLEGSFTATEIWSPITSYYDILAAPGSGLMYANSPWSGHYVVQGTIWATAHTTQFVQPGWQYLDASSGHLPDKGTYVSLRSPDKKNWSVVLETIGATRPQTVEFRLAGGLDASKVHIWETNNKRTFENVADLTVKDGTFKYSFEPDSLYSLTTTTGQGRGSAIPSPARGFPLPYGDDFESTREGGTPKYLSDQDGAFEVHKCAGRAGFCLEQVITEKPVPWSPLPDPFTLAGSETWTDYRVSVDVHFLSKAPALLMGRIDSANAFSDDKALLPGGYALRLEPSGKWDLLTSAYKEPTASLASGITKLDPAKWHRLELQFRGTTVTALLDGKTLVKTESEAHTHGMFALGTEWEHTQFDNLRLEP